ncbi:MAG: protein kinase [Acidobacteria bacterium]|nr:protein kinase [Acidobacteriota bacterium]
MSLPFNELRRPRLQFEPPIVERLGAGGMGVVYVAEDTRLHRRVALKFLPEHLTKNHDALERFQREARAASALNHPYICTIYDIDETDPSTDSAPPTGSGQAGSPQVAPFLEAAHAKGIIHRDLKPANVFLTTRGTAKLLDFGLAKLATESPPAASDAPTAAGEWVTGAGLALGTVGYMSPEQVRAEMPDARTDLFSLGVVLYEMATGTAPFRGATSGAVLGEILTKAPTALVRLNPDVPPELERIVNKALEKDPARRYQSARDLQLDLERLKRAWSVPAVIRLEQASIVVLPFENLSPDPDNAYFADGLAEEIIADLPKVRALRVISRTSAMHFKGTTKNLPAIAQELNVRHVLEGSVRRAGNSLRITAQLIDGASDAHLWAEKYVGTLDDVFDLQEKLSRRIVDGLKLSLTPEEDRRLAQRPMPDIRAHDIWLRARQSALTLTPEGLDRARDLVEQALAIVDDSALLHATLSWVHAIRYNGLVAGADDALRLVGHHAARALELDPNLAWSLFATSVVHLRQGDLPIFVRFATRALEVERDSHTLAVLGLHLASAGRLEAARRYAAEAAARDPLTWVTSFAQAHVDTQAGLADAAFDRLRGSVRRLARGDAWPTFELAYAALQADHEGEAPGWFREVAKTDVPLYSSMSRLFIRALENDRAGVADVLETSELRQLATREGRASYQLASCLAHVGETDKALTWLDRGIERWFTNHRFLSEFDRWLVPLRGDARFEALMEKAREKERAFEV